MNKKHTSSLIFCSQNQNRQVGGSSEHFSLALPLLLFSLFLLPLVINPGIFATFEETYLYPRLWWLYGIILPSALLLLANWKSPWKHSRPLLTVLAALSGWLVLSVFWNGAGWVGWWGQTDRADGVLMHLLYAVLLLAGWRWAQQDGRWTSKFGLALLIGGSLLALTNILQQWHLLGVPNANAFSGVAATPFGGTLGNRGYLGGAIALLLPFAMYQAGQIRANRPWAFLPVVLMVWALCGSFTRTAWLAGLVGVLTLLPLKLPWKIWGAALLGFLLWGGSTVLFHNTDLLTAKVGQGVVDSSGRGILWKSALYGIEKKPLLGWGTPALLKTFHARPLAELVKEQGIKDLKSFEPLPGDASSFPAVRVTYQNGKREKILLGGVDKVHNEYLDYALTYGIPAALGFLGLLGWAIWSSRLTQPGLAASLLAYAVYLLLWPELIRFAPVAWFMMGLALSGRRPAQ